MSTLPHDETNDVLTDGTTQGMSLIWGKLPNHFKKKVTHLLSMSNLRNYSQSMLLVQGTGDGKSLAYQYTGTIMRGVILVIERTLSLFLINAQNFRSR